MLLTIAFMSESRRTRSRAAVVVTATLLTGTMVASLLAVVFNEGPFIHLHHRGAEGPTAGLLMGDGSFADANTVDRLLEHCPEGELWAPGLPGAYVWADQRSKIPQYWLATFQLDSGFDALMRSGSVPQCVLAPASLADESVPASAQTWLGAGFEMQDLAAIHETDINDGPLEYGVYVRQP